MKESCRELGVLELVGPWGIYEKTLDVVLRECLLRGASWFELSLQDGDGAE